MRQKVEHNLIAVAWVLFAGALVACETLQQMGWTGAIFLIGGVFYEINRKH